MFVDEITCIVVDNEGDSSSVEITTRLLESERAEDDGAMLVCTFELEIILVLKLSGTKLVILEE